MLKLGREVKEREKGKIKLKKVVFVKILNVFSAIFGFQPIRTLDLIEINDQKLAPFNCFCRSSIYNYGGYTGLYKFHSLHCRNNMVLLSRHSADTSPFFSIVWYSLSIISVL